MPVIDLTTPCDLWTGATNGKYGQMRRRPPEWKPGDGPAPVVYVHRDAWEQAYGPIPEGMTIDHLCQRKLCRNVLHMEVVTREENSRRNPYRRPRPSHCNHCGSVMRVYSGRWKCPPCHQRRSATARERRRQRVA